jgi:hypothetical protein
VLICPIDKPILPVLLIVNVWAGDGLPTMTLPKSTGEPGITLISDATPKPFSPMATFGVSGSLEGIASVALLDPKDGVITTWIVQAPAVMVWFEHRSFWTANSGLLVLICPIDKLTLPVLFIVNVCAEDELPTLTLPKSTGELGTTSMFDATPKPTSAIFTVGASGSLDGIVSVAFLMP